MYWLFGVLFLFSTVGGARVDRCFLFDGSWHVLAPDFIGSAGYFSVVNDVLCFLVPEWVYGEAVSPHATGVEGGGGRARRRQAVESSTEGPALAVVQVRAVLCDTQPFLLCHVCGAFVHIPRLRAPVPFVRQGGVAGAVGVVEMGLAEGSTSAAGRYVACSAMPSRSVVLCVTALLPTPLTFSLVQLFSPGARGWRCTRRSRWALAEGSTMAARQVHFVLCNTQPFLPGARACSYFTPPPPTSSW